MRAVLLIVLFFGFITLLNTLFVVEQREQALVLQFGEPVRVVKDPGLEFKIPFVQNVVTFDKRILELDAKPREMIASDKNWIIVDEFAKYKITDPLKFYQSARNEMRFRDRLSDILDSRLREVIGGYPLITLLTEKRGEIMRTVRDNVNAKMQDFGVEVVDVRIMRSDLPEKNSQAIYARMGTEREEEAKFFRSQGIKQAAIITSEAEKQKTIILAEAEKTAQMTRGQGDATATKIFADAFGRDVDFFTFYRSMQAYKETLNKDNTSMVLSPDSEFLKYFGNMEGRRN